MDNDTPNRVGDICNRHVVQCSEDTGLVEIAQLMRADHVGSVVVTRTERGQTKPVGIVTDRDIVVGVVAMGTPIDSVAAADVCSTVVTALDEDASIQKAVDVMRNNAIKRLPIVDDLGALVGIVSADDVVIHLSNYLLDLAALAEMESANESRRRPRAPAADGEAA